MAIEKTEFEQPYITGIIDRFEGNRAVIILNTNQTLKFPKEKLPPKTNEGSPVRVIVSTDEQEHKQKIFNAKAMLNEILKGSK